MNSPADFALLGAVLEFVRDKDVMVHRQFFVSDDFRFLDDPVEIPTGMVVRVVMEYIPEEEVYGHTP